MRSFLKYTAATIVGICLTTFISFIFLIIIIAVSGREKPVELKPNTLLYITLNDRIVERSVDSPFNFTLVNIPMTREMGLNDILDNIRKAKTDDNITGIYLELSAISGGYGSVEEIRNALLDFRESGKFIVAYSDLYTQKTYYLASVADKIYLNPAGEFLFYGLGSRVLFYKGALEKLGIEAQVIRHGDYKSFVEPYTNEEMSPENREQLLAWVGSLWNHMLSGIAETRDLDVETLDHLAEDAAIRSAGLAVEHRLIDSLAYKDEILAKLKERTGTPLKDDLRSVTLRKYKKVPEPKNYRGIARDKIAVIYAYGDILVGNTGEGTIGSERISKAIRKARRDSAVKAIVLRVNSGGGSALASEVVWREVYLASEVKPLVASMGDMAASGGYYILTPADTILASPTSVTGSIGVFLMLPNTKSFLNKKLGINVDVAKTNKHADMGSIFRPLSEDEKEYLRYGVERVYESFVSRVSEGRNMPESDVDAIGGGRVWSGTNALENGLIDTYGGLHDAIRIAAGMAGIEKYRVQDLPRLEDPIEAFMRELTENMKNKRLMKELGESWQYLRTLADIENLSGMQMRIPYNFDIN